MSELPDLVAHADWGKNPGKRWMAVAIRSMSAYNGVHK